MAQKVTVTLGDDLTGGPAKQTVRFAVDGSDYEIDLIPAAGQNAYCERHPGVPLTYGGCHVCRPGDDERYRRW